MKASTVASVLIWSLPVLFYHVWTVGRLVAYNLQTAEWNKNDFKSTVLPDDFPEEIMAMFFKQVDLYFNWDQKAVLIRLHIAVAAVMGLICMLQLLPIIRKGSKLHRKLGWVHATLLVPFSLEMAYTLITGRMADMGSATYWGNAASLVIMVPTMALGVYYARNHRIRAHRACMMLHAAALYINPAQRFFWLLYSKANYGAPYADYAAWLSKPVAMSELTAFAACFSTALAYIAMGPANKQIKGKSA